MMNLIKLFRKRKQLLQHECFTPMESGITSSQILQIQNQLDLRKFFKNLKAQIKIKK